jgi:mannose-6-phosphate isomerase-like protein (cupin superfamily)
VFHLLHRADLSPSGRRSRQFEGAAYGAGVSFFLVESEPDGPGVRLHRHPYAETWIVRSGRAAFSVDGQEAEAGPGDVVVVEAGAPHRFRNAGTELLDLVCVHAAERTETEWLEARPASAGHGGAR